MRELKEIIRQDIQHSAAYAVANVASNVLKLDAMESPYELPEDKKQQLAKALMAAPLRRYPHQEIVDLIQHLRRVYAIPEAAAMALGNGSDELIALLALLVAQPGACVMAPEPAFVMYRKSAELYGLHYVGVAVQEDFSLDVETFLAAMAQHRPQLIFIAYPNNPTGKRYPRGDVEKIIQAAEGIVVIDEAYGAFSSDSLMDLAGQYEHVVIMRTFSKIGFAGCRLGYAAGHPKLMQELAKITPPYNMNQLTLATIQFVLGEKAWIDDNICYLKMQREILLSQLEDIDGVVAYPSEANFITLRVGDAEQAMAAFLQAGILIKNLSHMHPLLENCLRITVSCEADNQRVLAVLQAL